jgi:hypothetical protein
MALLTASVSGSEAKPPVAAPGTVAVERVAINDDGNNASFADAVGQALGEANFTLLPGHSRYVAEVSVVRTVTGVATTDAPKQRVVASPLAVSVPLPSHKTQLRDLVATTLTVHLLTRADRSPVWSGSAVTVAVDGAPVAVKLARAAVATYPQSLAKPVSVP